MSKITRENEAGSLSIPENLLVTSSSAFFLINSMQVGVGILGFERYIARDAGYDGWISILIAGGILHILLWMIFQILEDSKGDLVSIHRDVFGKYAGHFLSIIFSLYLLLLSVTVLRTFIEVIQVWIFPRLNVWIFTFIFLSIIYYFVAGGFRVVVAICLISTVLGLPILLLKYFPIQLANVENLFPVVDHSLSDILKSVKTATLSFLGIELLLIYYPFLKYPQSSRKWAHFGVFFTVLIYLGSALVSFVYYNEDQLQHMIWATITLWKIVEFPFIERFEYVGIAMWVYIIIPNICLALWAATRVLKRIFKCRQKKFLWVYFFITFLATGLLGDRQSIDLLNKYTGIVGFYVLLYIPVLFILTKLVNKVRNRK
ncbi:spore germination protein [Pseudalkalibacillus decolorationis]|uniref:spore germination protein n=1 Tax=Pseudalkalibacillus decolorationis TaxID=163879 RepID=UPI002147A7C3|nr:spore germination protein [Pseudalkalibacillus decolorationis]